MRKQPLIVTVARVVIIIFICRCMFRLTLGLLYGWHDVLYGMLLAPGWLDMVFGLAATICFLRSRDRTPLGVVACALPVLGWFLLTVFSPESWTAWHWISAGGPAEPPGLPAAYSYRFSTYERVAGGAIMAFAEEFVFTMLLLRLLFGAESREYFGFKWRSPVQIERGDEEA